MRETAIAAVLALAGVFAGLAAAGLLHPVPAPRPVATSPAIFGQER